MSGATKKPYRGKRGGGEAKVRVYLEGRYRKLARGLPQTIFYCPKCKGRRRGCAFCGGYGKLTKDSVQELIARKVLPRYKARMGKFHGAGREDVDVRMLGGGRPFVFEVVQPRRFDVDLEELVEAINAYGKGRMEITALRPVRRKRVAELKETRSDKVYRALVVLDRVLPEDRLQGILGEPIVVTQRTPKRVAHRRADRDRTRKVEVLEARAFRGPESQPCLDLLVRCEHGTYVKEWISGEEGRSRPSLGELLGAETDCLVLDVWEICGPFPSVETKGPEPCFDSVMEWEQLLREEDPWDLERLKDASPRGVTQAPTEVEPDPQEEQGGQEGDEGVLA
ncbi:MAG TPA: hypothetical protein ENK02_07040 [Planctomycetes bacterium]|nr:hypothetical protein [Planctomycetota bacterium]